MNIINGNGRPTDRTVGDINDIYVDSISGTKYKCVGEYEIVSDVVTHYYVWVRTVTTSQSTNDSGQYVDQTTGRTYVLKVDNGKLTMEEV